MKLGSLKSASRDGALVVFSDDLTRFAPAGDIARSLLEALEHWDMAEPRLRALSARLDAGTAPDAQMVEASQMAACLPRAPQFVDGSAFLNHVELVRRARGAEMPPSFLDDPLMYQAVSDAFLAPGEDIVCGSEDWGIDFEAEVGVVVDDVPMGVTPEAARDHIKLVLILNDVSLRGLIPAELGKGFGFLQGKPRSALSMAAVTPDGLGAAWDGGKLHLPLACEYNGKPYGRPNAGVDMQFDFPRLIAHAARSRPLAAGSIVGSGTISNKDESVGSCCLAEVRMIEMIRDGKPSTPFMRFGDRIRITMPDAEGRSVFGAIDQRVVKG
jgi:fumarylacetoacetate (FAA) hydrolase